MKMVSKRAGGCGSPKKTTMSLVAERRPLMKKKNKKTQLQYFKKVFDYLFSDDYMFAPLLSSHFSSPNTSSIGIEESSAKVHGDKDFVDKVGDYLKCDCYLYSPLVITQPWLISSSAHALASQRAGLHCLPAKKDIRSNSDVEDLLKELADKTDKPAVEKTAISVSKEQINLKGLHDRSTIIKRSRVRRETVKHIIDDLPELPPMPITGKELIKKGMVEA
ncbi:PREDICTED: uncharacterized protein LOC109153890 isoform X2 [Ipomoea nil]|uniref:uncharacterized protein LOC109153890 isoform X2 n=1 Tax=Ipomoea nil TaxID=35883 RepID=UPI000901A1F5|nr:PREDICTED: uncharacterized protein LOC109153890 isoform X2 [Ipomoea nil]